MVILIQTCVRVANVLLIIIIQLGTYIHGDFNTNMCESSKCIVYNNNTICTNMSLLMLKTIINFTQCMVSKNLFNAKNE